MPDMTIGERIDRVIKEKKLVIKDVANALGITEQYFKRVRSGKVSNVSMAIYKAFCYEFQIHLPWLLKGEGEPFLHAERSETIPADLHSTVEKYSALTAEDREWVDKVIDIFISEEESTKEAVRNSLREFRRILDMADRLKQTQCATADAEAERKSKASEYIENGLPLTKSKG